MLELTKNLKYLATPVPDFSFAPWPTEPYQLGRDLLETLYSKGGAGLAANQCGLPYRCFVMAASPADFICFNPTIVHESPEHEEQEEGCLSLPGLRFIVSRPKSIRLRFTLPDGHRITTWLQGYTARIAIHETMHLDGKYFFEGVSRLKLEKAIKQAKKKGYNYEGLGLLAHCA